MKGWVCIQMPANGIGMEGNKDDIDELSGNQLQMCKRRRSADGLHRMSILSSTEMSEWRNGA
jgi:hypothetical protein